MKHIGQHAMVIGATMGACRPRVRCQIFMLSSPCWSAILFRSRIFRARACRRGTMRMAFWRAAGLPLGAIIT